MGHKIFVSYKYRDRDVAPLPDVISFTWCRDYVDFIEKNILPKDNHIYKGEDNSEDLSDKSENYIWNHLKDKMYDSTVTLVLLSPNMKEAGKWQRSQWIPWEISFSLRETTRNGRTSQRNAILGIILPNAKGSYSWYDKNNLFPILKSNIDNGYINVVRWDNFLKNPDLFITLAEFQKSCTPSYKIVVNL